MKLLFSHILILIITLLLLGCDLIMNPDESKIYTFQGKVLNYNDNSPIDSAEVYIYIVDMKFSGNQVYHSKRILQRYITSEAGDYIFVIKRWIHLGEPVYLTAEKKGYRISQNNSNLSSFPYKAIRYYSEEPKNVNTVKIDILMEKDTNP